MDVVSRISIKLSVDSNEYLIHEGDMIRNLTYTRKGNSSTISGAVRLIDVTTRASTKIEQTCPPESYVNQLVAVNALYIDVSSKYKAAIEKIALSEITSIGTVETPKAGEDHQNNHQEDHQGGDPIQPPPPPPPVVPPAPPEAHEEHHEEDANTENQPFNPETGDVNASLAKLEDGATLKFLAGDVNQKFNITKSVTLEGSTSGASQNSSQEV